MRNSCIEVFIDCVDRACRFPSPVTTSRIREELLRQQPDYLDFIFFSANNGEQYLYSTNDTINETPIQAFSLFQTKKFTTQVPQLEEQIANLKNIADQNSVLKKEIQDKTIQINQLEEKLQSTEDKLNQLQVSNRTENLNIYTEQLNSYKNQIELKDSENYEMKWKIKGLEDQISSLMSEKINYSQQLNIVNKDLTNFRRSYQQLEESQKEINRQSKNQILVQVRDLEKIKIDLSNMALENENLQERIKIYEKENEKIELELKQQLIDAKNEIGEVKFEQNQKNSVECLQQQLQEKDNKLQNQKQSKKNQFIKQNQKQNCEQIQDQQQNIKTKQQEGQLLQQSKSQQQNKFIIRQPNNLITTVFKNEVKQALERRKLPQRY